MSEPGTHFAQLDRIEQGVSDIRDRLARMEVRQDNHGAEIEAHKSQLENITRRLHDLEVSQAVAGNTEAKHHGRVMDRWSALGAVGMLLLGAFATAAAMSLINLFGD